ncbi:MAG: hypothetical protein WBA16_09615 [Nonlabens sp.]
MKDLQVKLEGQLDATDVDMCHDESKIGSFELVQLRAEKLIDQAVQIIQDNFLDSQTRMVDFNSHLMEYQLEQLVYQAVLNKL